MVYKSANISYLHPLNKKRFRMVFKNYFVVMLLCMLPVFSISAQKIFLVAGQSNAMGVGNANLSPTCMAGTAFEYSAVKNILKPLSDPVGENEFGFEQAKTGSAWPSFAKQYNNITGNSIIIIPAARGGSSCSPLAPPELSWNQNGNLTNAAIEKTNSCLRNVNSPGLSGVIWIQGESDASLINRDGFSAESYKSELKTIILKFRHAFGENLPFYIVQTGLASGESVDGYEAIQNSQERICQEMPYVYLVYRYARYFNKYGLMGDYIHYNQAGYNILGKTIAEVIVKIDEHKFYEAPPLVNNAYPNPTSNKIQLHFINVALQDNASLAIIDEVGLPVKTVEIGLSSTLLEETSIETNNLAPGTYFFYLKLGGLPTLRWRQIILNHER
jgi:hypothetical protein